MSPLAMIAEWRRGCTCADVGTPEECQACTAGLIDALQKRLIENESDRSMASMTGRRIAEAMQKCDWANHCMGNTSILQAAIALLFDMPVPTPSQIVEQLHGYKIRIDLKRLIGSASSAAECEFDATIVAPDGQDIASSRTNFNGKIDKRNYGRFLDLHAKDQS